jgi:hypothetical protein
VNILKEFIKVAGGVERQGGSVGDITLSWGAIVKKIIQWCEQLGSKKVFRIRKKCSNGLTG